MPREKVPDILLGIPRNHAIELVDNDGPLVVVQTSRKPQPEGRTCPHCGRTGCRVHAHVWRRMFHAPAGGLPCALRAPARRRRCPDCGRTHSGPDGTRGDDCPHTGADPEMLVAAEPVRRQPIRRASHRPGAGEAMARHVPGTMPAPGPRLPRVLCTGESEADTDRGKRAVAIAGGEQGCLAGVLPDRSAATPGARFPRFPEADREAAGAFNCDIRPARISAAERWPPRAEVCPGRFHVAGARTRAPGKVRVRARNPGGIAAAKAKKPEGCMRILCMRPADLAERGAKRVARGKESPAKKVVWALAPGPDPELAHERPMASCERGDGGGSRRGLVNWVSVSQDCGVPEPGSAARTTRRHSERILAGRRPGGTNAVAEGTDSAIKAPERVCFGFGKLGRMRRRCLLVLGSTKLVEMRLGLKDIPKARPRDGGTAPGREATTPRARRRTEEPPEKALRRGRGGARPRNGSETSIVGDSHNV